MNRRFISASGRDWTNLTQTAWTVGVLLAIQVALAAVLVACWALGYLVNHFIFTSPCTTSLGTIRRCDALDNVLAGFLAAAAIAAIAATIQWLWPRRVKPAADDVVEEVC